MIKDNKRFCLVCGTDITDRSLRTKYCSSVCRSKVNKEKMEKKYGNLSKLRYDVQLKREELINLKGNKCYFCGEKNKQQLLLHHESYKNNELNNLFLLCHKCHTKLHIIKNIGKDIKK